MAFPSNVGPNSFCRSPNRGYLPVLIRPPRCTRTSELLLPPKTGRSCTNATFKPSLAAATAALIPATPPPTTTRSNTPAERIRWLVFNILSRYLLRSSWPSGGATGDVLRQMASHRPSKPVRSHSASVAIPRLRFTVPAFCHCHRSPVWPTVTGKRLPLMVTLNPPGPVAACHGAVQL